MLDLIDILQHTSVIVAIRSLNKACSTSKSSIVSLIGGIMKTALAPTLLVYPSGSDGSDSEIDMLSVLAEKLVTMLRRRFRGVREQFLRLINEYCDDEFV